MNNNRKWFIIDAQGVPLGRMATKAAVLLQGKGKIDFSFNLDGGDFVIVINARHLQLTGKKMDQKTYFRHSGYPGGTTYTVASKLIKIKPEEMVRRAVKGMLPKNRLGSGMITRLKIYPEGNHPHVSQKPEMIKWKK